MKTPCYVMLCCYVKSSIDWAYVETDEELKYITDHLLGDPEKGFEWIPYAPSPHYNSYVVDSDELCIIKPTLEECIDEALQATRELCMARYADGVTWIDEYQHISFDEYLKPFIEDLETIIRSDSFKQGTLKDYVDVFA